MNSFSNDVIESSELPRYEEASLTPVSDLYWRVILINLAITILVVGAIIAGILLIAGASRSIFLTAGVLFILLFGGIYLLQKQAFRRRGYAVRQHDIIYRRGTIGTKTTVIPFQRIQHVNVNEGLFSRAYGLAQLQIFTAGGAGSDIRISGLLREDAAKIKELILNKVASNEL
jgi:membrane protein YdbS with pleckstrin-like domain